MAELESAGVGRPSTYAKTLKTLVDVVHAAEAGGGRVAVPELRGADGGVPRVGPAGPGVPHPAELSWAPKKARRSAAKKESSEKAASEQAAADQRLQARCGECGGAQQRWKAPSGGYVYLCAAWPGCGGVAVEAGRGAGPGDREPEPRARATGGELLRRALRAAVVLCTPARGCIRCGGFRQRRPAGRRRGAAGRRLRPGPVPSRRGIGRCS